MRILVTAFDPFGGLDTNSSMMVLNELGDKIGDIKIKKLIIPTIYGECARIAWEEALAFDADAIVSLGQAGGRSAVTVEVIGINYACANVDDNAGVKITGERLCDDGKAAYFSTLPVKEMTQAAKACGFKADLSLSAGGFVCNSLLYTLLKNAHESGKAVLVGFVHLPYEASQGKDGFSMTKEDMAVCVEEMIKAINNFERN